MNKIIIFLIVTAFSLSFFSCSPPGSLRQGGQGSQRGKIVSTAKQYTGVPYKRGGTTPRGFDCSGFVLYVYKKNNINLPRTTAEQYKQGRRISPNALRPGDLVFFQTSHKRISHVGIYVGNSKFIHAPSSGKKTSYSSLDNIYWRKRLRGAVSYL